MWIKRAEWLQLTLKKVEAEFRAEQAETWRDNYRQETIKLHGELVEKDVRIKELSARILEMQDELNQARKLAARPVPMILDADSFFEEDPTLVEEQRQRIKEDGADAILAQQANDSSLGAL